MSSNIGYYFYYTYYDDFFTNRDMWVASDKIETNLSPDAKKKLLGERAKFFEEKNQKLYNLNAITQQNELNYNDALINGKFELITTYPGLLIGTGYLHETGTTGEVKSGFYFDHTTGLPMLPGTSLKGVIRSAFPGFNAVENKCNFSPETLEKYLSENKTSKEKVTTAVLELEQKFEKAKFLNWIIKDVISEDLIATDYNDFYCLEQMIFENINYGWLKASDEEKGKHIKNTSVYNRDIFHDCFIKESRHSNKQLLGFDYITPHKHASNPEYDVFAEPVPLQIVKILPNVVFLFNLSLNNFETDKLGYDAAKKLSIFKKIIEVVGIGAKTNVGYGNMIGLDQKPSALPLANNAHFLNPEPPVTTLVDYTGKLKINQPITAKSTLSGRNGRATIMVNGELEEVAVAGNCPETGMLFKGKINQIKNEKIIQIGYLGIF